MSEEYIQLLLQDLCARLPYGVNVSLQTGKRKLTGVLDAVYPTDDRVIVDNLSEAIAPINVRTGGFLIERDNVKPYLRPMSSMTEEEEKEYLLFSLSRNNTECLDWLNTHHFDYRGLIEKGLALEAPEGMYK